MAIDNSNATFDKSQTGSEHQFDNVLFLSIILKYKIIIIITMAAVFVASTIISMLMPNWYSSTVNAVPPKKTVGSIFEGAMGSISTTLKDFGLTKLTGKGEGYSYLVILNSRTVRDSMIKRFDLAKAYNIPDTMKTALYKELESNLEITDEREGNFTVTVYDKNPQKAADMANAFIEISNFLAQDIFQKEASTSRKYIESRLSVIDSTLTYLSETLRLYSKKTGIFSPADQAKSVSSAYSDMKAELMKQELVYDILKNKFGANDPTTKQQQKLIESIKSKVSDMETKAGFAGNFSLQDAAKVGLEYLRLYSEYETFTKVKEFLLPMLEDAKLDESRNTQSLIVLDAAVPPDKKAYPKRSLIIAGSTLGAFFISVLFVFLINAYKNFKEKYILIRKSGD